MAQTVTGVTTFLVPEWLPADTEESVVGTEWHQEAIGALADMVQEVARRRGASWGVCQQVALLDTGARYPDGHSYEPRPDVMVLAQPLPWGGMSSIRLADAGVPLFIAEVASKSTIGNDVGTKKELYEMIGVPEYIVFDAVGNVLSTPLLAWHLESGSYVPWLPEADGLWQSSSLDIRLQVAQPFLGIIDHDGRRIELSHEVRERALRLEQQLTAVQERLAAAEQARVASEQARAEEAQRRAELEEQVRRLRQGRDDPP